MIHARIRTAEGTIIDEAEMEQLHGLLEAPGSLIWPGLLRRLDRADDSWRH